MRIEALDPYDESDHLDWYRPQAAAEAFDWPEEPGWSNKELAARNRDQSAGQVLLAVVREEDGSVAGSVSLFLPRLDNTEVAEMWLAVSPEKRRRGAGGLLLAHAEQEARRAGRTKLVARTESPLGADGSTSERFAHAHGFEAALAEERRVLELPPAPGLLDRLERELQPHARGYEVTRWSGTCPEPLLDDLAHLFATISTDAPQGSLEKEEESWDAARVRRNEKTAEEMGRLLYCAGALQEQTGRLVAVTELSAPRERPATCYQLDTVVERGERGHRLGALVKIANLRQLMTAVPGARRILTWNAAANAPMIAVNELLGFKLAGRSTNWMKRLG